MPAGCCAYAHARLSKTENSFYFIFFSYGAHDMTLKSISVVALAFHLRIHQIDLTEINLKVHVLNKSSKVCSI